MAEIKFTPEIFEQTDLVQTECNKLQALLDDNLPDTTFVWCAEEDKVNMIPSSSKGKREQENPLLSLMMTMKMMMN
jgi:hypothetical protein